MKTIPEYLNDPYLKEVEAIVLDIVKHDNGQVGIVLDKTCFYPIGGGQNCDTGKFILSDSSYIPVKEVVIKNGEINHFVENIGEIKIGSTVRAQIDWERRHKNMIIHSAAHVIDFALQKLNVEPQKLKPLKGSHGKNAHVVYEGEVDATLMFKQLKKEVNTILNSNLEFDWKFVDFETLKNIATYLQPGLPTNKPLRALSLKNYGTVADGGTIVRNTKEIAKIEIPRIEQIDGSIIVYYNAIASMDSNTYSTKPNKISVVSNDTLELSEYISSLDLIKKQLEDDLEQGLLSVNELKNKYLGRKSELVQLVRSISKINQSDRAKGGVYANNIKKQVESLINSSFSSKDSSSLSDFDVTLPGNSLKLGHLHLTTQAIREVEAIFKRMGFYRERYPEVEWDYYAFDALNMGPDHPARDDWETFFIDKQPVNKDYGKRLLTPHTSSGQVREMLKRKPPIRMINISRVYRRQLSVRHLMNFFQFEGLMIDKHITFGHLKGVIEYFLQEFLGDEVKYRIRPYHFRFTEPSIEIDVFLGKDNKMTKEGWLEIGGAGMVHPSVLEAGNIDPDVYSGYAFGFGVERNKLSVGGINLEDIRIMYQTDVRFLEQF